MPPEESEYTEFVNAFLVDRFAVAIENTDPVFVTEEAVIRLGHDRTRKQVRDNMVRRASGDRKLVEAIKDLFRRNPADGTPFNIRDVDLPTNFVAASRIDTVAMQDGKRFSWQRFRETYPRSEGFVSLSLPGMSKDGTVAIICIGHVQGGLSGRGGYCVYRKEAGAWKKMRILIGPRWTS